MLQDQNRDVNKSWWNKFINGFLNFFRWLFGLDVSYDSSASTNAAKNVPSKKSKAKSQLPHSSANNKTSIASGSKTKTQASISSQQSKNSPPPKPSTTKIPVSREVAAQLAPQLPQTSLPPVQAVASSAATTNTSTEFKTPGEGKESQDSNVGIRVIHTAVVAISYCKLAYDVANESCIAARQAVNEAKILQQSMSSATSTIAETVSEIQNAIKSNEQILASEEIQLARCVADLEDQYKNFRELIVATYEKPILSASILRAPNVMDGIKKLNSQEIALLADIFDCLYDKNLLTDDRVYKLSSALESNAQQKASNTVFLTILGVFAHQDSKIQKENIDRFLTGQAEREDYKLLNVDPNLCYEPVPGDGSCMYSSVLFYLNIPGNSRNLRQDMAGFISREENQKKYIELGILWRRDGKPYDDINSYLDALSDKDDFAEQIDVMVLMDMLKRPIAIIGPDGMVCNDDDVRLKSAEFSDISPIFIYYNKHGHYSGLILNEKCDVKNLLLGLLGKTDIFKKTKQKPIEATVSATV